MGSEPLPHVAGEGINPDGVAQGWVLYLEDPSPNAVPALGAGAFAALALGLVTLGVVAGLRLRAP